MPPTLSRGVIIGTVLQTLMVVCGHFIPQLASAFPIIGTAIGGVAGYFANRGTAAALGTSAGVGAGAGVISGVIGTLISVALGDVPLSTVGIAGASTAVLGAIGGLIARATAKSATV